MYKGGGGGGGGGSQDKSSLTLTVAREMVRRPAEWPMEMEENTLNRQIVYIVCKWCTFAKCVACIVTMSMLSGLHVWWGSHITYSAHQSITLLQDDPHHSHPPSPDDPHHLLPQGDPHHSHSPQMTPITLTPPR